MIKKQVLLIVMISCLVSYLTSSFVHANNSQYKQEMKPNAVIWQDGDGMMLIYYGGHFFQCYPGHVKTCPCQQQEDN